jgi:hypothetical protein
MKKKSLAIIALLIGMFIWGCYPSGPTYTQDLDVVITHHNPDYSFKGKETYAMPDRIVKITGNLQKGDPPEFIPDAIAAQILTMIASNMTSLGYQRVAITASPDLLLTPAVWESTYMYYYYDYWYWWWGGYYPGWPYYPPIYGYSYTTGTLMMALIDPDELNGSGNPISQWTGAINGILESKFNASRVSPLIDKAFDQSPYLKTN